MRMREALGRGGAARRDAHRQHLRRRHGRARAGGRGLRDHPRKVRHASSPSRTTKSPRRSAPTGTDTHNLAEGAGAAPLAALMQERERMRGKAVGVILCGGNIDTDWMRTILAGGVPQV